ncbi:MAG: UDP-N-acetylmuramoyl-tripeptide--D-alanyl-D-alanine ligase [Chlamydiae bacterium]|nr:UDP-N-acetylmuramoyl-tripeptide--D-alanyl-D-alanine ligase [Chlamydiota bacterium]
MRKTLREITHFFGQESDRTDQIVHVACDSRKVERGSLFFALKGEKVDGESFLEESAKRGAVGAVVSKGYSGPDFGCTLIRVDDVTRALQELACEVYQESHPFVVGVTGSAGKTTTKEFIATLLAEKFPVGKSSGSMNSQVGLPLTLLNWKGEERVIVLEMGMSHKGEIARLIEIAPPDLGVLTNISYQHSAFFPDLDAIARAKCEMFASPKMKMGIFNLGVERFQAVKELELSKEWFHLSDLRADYTLKKVDVSAPFEESHFNENFLAAVAVARSFDLSWEEIGQGAKKLKPYDHRFQKKEKRGILFIDDAYNASPLSVKAALANLPPGRRRIGLLGAMGELGDMEERCHREVGECAVKVLDQLICIGATCTPMVEIFRREGKEGALFETKEEATEHLKSVMREGDVVLIKGSNLQKLWTILERI